MISYDVYGHANPFKLGSKSHEKLLMTANRPVSTKPQVDTVLQHAAQKRPSTSSVGWNGRLGQSTTVKNLNLSYGSSTSIGGVSYGSKPSHMQSLLESRRQRYNTSISQDIIDKQQVISGTKNDFLQEKAYEKKTLTNMISKLKTQTN